MTSKLFFMKYFWNILSKKNFMNSKFIIMKFKKICSEKNISECFFAFHIFYSENALFLMKLLFWKKTHN